MTAFIKITRKRRAIEISLSDGNETMIFIISFLRKLWACGRWLVGYVCLLFRGGGWQCGFCLFVVFAHPSLNWEGQCWILETFLLLFIQSVPYYLGLPASACHVFHIHLSFSERRERRVCQRLLQVPFWILYLSCSACLLLVSHI